MIQHQNENNSALKLNAPFLSSLILSPDCSAHGYAIFCQNITRKNGAIERDSNSLRIAPSNKYENYRNISNITFSKQPKFSLMPGIGSSNVAKRNVIRTKLHGRLEKRLPEIAKLRDETKKFKAVNPSFCVAKITKTFASFGEFFSIFYL